MKKKTLSAVLAVALTAAVVLPGCSGGSTASSAASSEAASSEAASSAAESTAAGSIPKYEDIQFQDSLPSGIVKADGLDYSYDDMSKSYDISILTTNYGTPALAEDKDPVCQWLEKKFNVKIKYESLNGSDYDTTISTRASSGELPDVTIMSKDLATQIYEQGLSLDGKIMYPYMPLRCKYVTKNMITATTDAKDSGLIGVTQYGIQDGVWGLALRTDWLKKFNMEWPTTEDALIAYAKACTNNDPDGDGKQDTWFMMSCCENTSVTAGMNSGLALMYGSPYARVDNGALSDPLFNGVRLKVITALNKFYAAGTFHPDWYTMEWEKGKAYTLNDKIGCLYYPAGALESEYTGAQNKKDGSWDVWEWNKTPLVEGGKWQANGNLGNIFVFSKAGVADEGKQKRIAHMMDTMLAGGENFQHTSQGGDDDIWTAIGTTVETPRKWVFNDDGTFYFTNKDGKPWNDNTLMGATGPWQNFGLPVMWQLAGPSDDATTEKINEQADKYAKVIMNYDRWPNDGLLSTVATENIAPGITDYVNAQELAFVTGKRPLSEWDAYTKEWLAKGGKDIIAQEAKQLSVDVPDYAK